jgi:hypothetical protein
MLPTSGVPEMKAKKPKKVKRYGFKPLVVDWNGLKAMGWPFCREETVARNCGRYPESITLGKHLNARRLWRVSDVLDYFERHGLKVRDDWYRSPDEELATMEDEGS